MDFEFMTHRFDEMDSWRTKVRLSMSKRSDESYQRSDRVIIYVHDKNV